MTITATKYAGRAMLLGIGSTAVPGSATYTTVGGVRTKAFSSSTEEIDISDGDDGVHKKGLEGGSKATSFSVSGLGSNDTSYELMKAKEQAGTFWAFQLSGVEDGDSIKGLFLITSFEVTGEYNGAQQFSATLVAQDTPTYTSA